MCGNYVAGRVYYWLLVIVGERPDVGKIVR